MHFMLVNAREVNIRVFNLTYYYFKKSRYLINNYYRVQIGSVIGETQFTLLLILLQKIHVAQLFLRKS